MDPIRSMPAYPCHRRASRFFLALIAIACSVQSKADQTVSFLPVAEHPGQAWALEFKTPANAQWHTGEQLISFGSNNALPLSLAVVEEGLVQLLQFRITTTFRDIPLNLAVPLALLKTDRKHDFLLRYLGFKVDLFCDGVLVDEEWPMGEIRFASGAEGATVHPPIEGARLVTGALSDDSIQKKYGGRTVIAERADELFGPEPSQAQYLKPRGWNTNAGDAMPFYHDGVFHLFYLIDRRHHRSKWGLGAHQWAHISTKDLVHWTRYPVALPITEQWEGSICTGSVFYDKGTYYAFYATRMPDRKEHLAVALSKDGVHFEKVRPTPFSGPQAPFREGPNRDPSVIRDADGYLMLVTASLTAKKDGKEQGALEQLVSKDLKTWSASDVPFLVPGYSPDPECSDLFLWHGRYYLLFGIGGVTHYRISSNLHGPWTKPAVDILDAGEARVMKSAAYHNDRRILVGWVGNANFGGNLIFRELLQNPDGTLGTKFPAEMDLKTKRDTTIQVDKSQSSEPLNQSSTAEVRIMLNSEAAESGRPYGLTFRGEDGHLETLLADPAQGRVQWLNTTGRVTDELANVPELKRRGTIEVVRSGDLVDICVDQRRTMIHRLGITKPEISFFTRDSQ